MAKIEVAERSCRRRSNPQTTPETPSPVSEGNEQTQSAEWIRLPAPGERCPHTGMMRGTYNDLIFTNPPKIKSVIVKKPDASRGIRLIYLPSVKDYLLELMERHMAELEIDCQKEGSAS